MYNGYGMGFGGGFMWLFWIVLIVGVVWVVRALGGPSAGQRQAKTPREILDGRYARGEIDESDYRRRRKELES